MARSWTMVCAWIAPRKSRDHGTLKLTSETAVRISLVFACITRAAVMTNPYQTPSAAPDDSTVPVAAVRSWRRQVLTIEFLQGAFLAGIPCEIWLTLNFLHPARGWILAAAMMAGGVTRVLMRGRLGSSHERPVSVGSSLVCLVAAVIWAILLPESIDSGPYERFRQRLRQRTREQTGAEGQVSLPKPAAGLFITLGCEPASVRLRRECPCAGSLALVSPLGSRRPSLLPNQEGVAFSPRSTFLFLPGVTS